MWVRFAAVGDQRLGKMLDQRGNRGELKPYLRNTNVQWMRIELGDVKQLRLEQDELCEYRLLPGDLLICEGGEPGRCAIWRDESHEMYFQKAIHRVRPRKGILSKYLAVCLQVDAKNGVLTNHFTGATIKHLTGRSLCEYVVPLPPLAEQKRIVAKVAELMALCDQLESQKRERDARHTALTRAALVRFADAPTPANLQLLFHRSYAIPPADLRKTILTLAVQGKLVPQDPSDESTAITWPPLTPLRCESSDRAVVPNRWALSSYRALTTLITSGSRGWKEFYAQKGSIFVRTQNIKTDRLVLEEIAFVDLPRSLTGMRAQVLKDDILVTITGANVTKAARVEEQIPQAYVSQHIALTRPRWSEMSAWLHLCFISHGSARGALEQLAYGDKPGLNLNNIRDLVLPVPPLAEQRRIMAKVVELMALVDELESQFAISRAAAANLLSAVVAELTSAN